MEVNESLGIEADLRVTARNPETGEEEVVVDTEEGIGLDEAEIEVASEEERTNDD